VGERSQEFDSEGRYADTPHGLVERIDGSELGQLLQLSHLDGVDSGERIIVAHVTSLKTFPI